MAERQGISPAQVALAWVMGREGEGVSAPIFGATRLEQLEEAIEATDVELDARTVKSLGSRLQARVPRWTRLRPRDYWSLGRSMSNLVTHRGIPCRGSLRRPWRA